MKVRITFEFTEEQRWALTHHNCEDKTRPATRQDFENTIRLLVDTWVGDLVYDREKQLSNLGGNDENDNASEDAGSTD